MLFGFLLLLTQAGSPRGYEIRAGSLEFVREAGEWVMHMTEEVVIQGDGLILEARSGRYFQDRNVLELFGSVVLHRGGARLQAESLRIWVGQDSLLAWGGVWLEDSVRRIRGDSLLSARDSSILWGEIQGEIRDRGLRFSGRVGILRKGGAAELWGAPRFWIFRAETVEARAHRFHSRSDTLWGLGGVQILLRDGRVQGEILIFLEDSAGERARIIGDARFEGKQAQGRGDTVEVRMVRGKPRRLTLLGGANFAVESESLRIRLQGPQLVIELSEEGEIHKISTRGGKGLYIRKEKKGETAHGRPEG